MIKAKILCLLALFSSANYAATHPAQVEKGEVINYSYQIYKDGAFILHGEQSVNSGENAYFSVKEEGVPVSDISLCISSYERNGFLYSNMDFSYSEGVSPSIADVRTRRKFEIKRPLFLKSGERRIIRFNDERYSLTVSARINSN